MKAFRGSDGNVEYFKFDNEHPYADSASGISNVTYNSDGSVA